jgi:hypothetical protein
MISAQFRRREPAQVIVLFAISLVAMLALLAVALDGGTLYLQRRTAQNAADAAALAGGRALQQATVALNTTVPSEICKYVLSNNFGVKPTTNAYFIKVDGTPVAGGTISLPTNCAGPVASTLLLPTTSGVHVDVTMGPYNTYLAGIVGIRQLEARASASAQVGVLSIPAPDLSPLAGCGPDMLTNGTSPDPLDARNILKGPAFTSIDEGQYGADLVLQGSQMSQNENASCPKWNTSSSAWKGQIDTSGVTGPLTPPFPIPVATGNGTVDNVISDLCLSIYGPGHDPAGSRVGDNLCYLLIPIAAPPNPTNEANIVTFACFSLYDGGDGTQKWRGILVAISDSTCNMGVFPPSWTFGNTNNQTQVMLTK